MSNPEKGNFSADISEDAVREALESVKRHTGGGPTDEVEPVDIAATDPDPQPPGDEVSAVESGQPDPAATDQSAAEKELESLRAQLEFSMAKGRDLMGKVKESHERMLRAVADLDNYKKRAQKEKEDVQRYGIEKLLRDFLPVIDNLERALEASKQGTDIESLRQGVTMTRKQFEDTLGRNGVKGFTSVGQPFDPHVHEAMQQIETSEIPPNHVVVEMVRGYTLNDRLIRPALVAVAKAPAAAEPPAQDASQPSEPGEDPAKS